MNKIKHHEFLNRFFYFTCLVVFLGVSGCTGTSAQSTLTSITSAISTNDVDQTKFIGSIDKGAKSTYTALTVTDSTGATMPLYATLLISSQEIVYGHTGDTIFSINPDGSNYKLLHTFSADANNWGPSDTMPGDFITLDNSIYGISFSNGGAYSDAPVMMHIFAMNLDGTNYHSIYSINISNGSSLPPYGFQLVGVDHSICGLANGQNVFCINKDGTDYRIIHTFSDTEGSPSALVVCNGLILGGAFSAQGAINLFAAKPDGSSFKFIRQLDKTLIGSGDPTDVHFAVSGSTLYGALRGSSSIFKIQNDGTNFRIIHNFTGDLTSGIVVNNGVIFGNVLVDSENDYFNALFRMNADGSNFGILHSFDFSQTMPTKSIVVAGNNVLGFSRNGYSDGYYGFVYSMGPINSPEMAQGTDRIDVQNCFGYKKMQDTDCIHSVNAKHFQSKINPGPFPYLVVVPVASDETIASGTITLTDEQNNVITIPSKTQSPVQANTTYTLTYDGPATSIWISDSNHADGVKFFHSCNAYNPLLDFSGTPLSPNNHLDFDLFKNDLTILFNGEIQQLGYTSQNVDSGGAIDACGDNFPFQEWAGRTYSTNAISGMSGVFESMAAHGTVDDSGTSIKVDVTVFFDKNSNYTSGTIKCTNSTNQADYNTIVLTGCIDRPVDVLSVVGGEGGGPLD